MLETRLSCAHRARSHRWTTFLPAIVPVFGIAGSLVLAQDASPRDDALNRRANHVLALRASELGELDLRNGVGRGVTADVAFAGENHSLELVPVSVRGEGYRVLLERADGSLVEALPGPETTYRGVVSGMPGSAVAATVGAKGVSARVFLADGNEFWVEPAGKHLPDAAANSHVLYWDDDITPPLGTCDGNQAAPAEEDGKDAGTKLQSTAAAGVACGTGLCEAEVAFDADYEFFLAKGSSVGAVEQHIASIVNAVNVQYERDVNVRNVVSTIVVRTTASDPYSATDAGGILTEFRNHWNGSHTSIQRDYAQLFTGKNVDGSTIGIAWVGALCGSYGYSVVQGNFTSSFGALTDLSAHEWGHNWNASHCDCASSPAYTMNPWVTAANQFNPDVTIPVIESYRDSRSCLSGVNDCLSDTDCDDGAFCNGSEWCNAGGCESTGDPCQGEDCDEASDSCVPRVCNADGTCNGDEDCENCPGDCPVGTGANCGDGVCESGAGEDCVNCPSDCNGSQKGKPAGRWCCGEGGTNPLGCADDRCFTGGKSCTNAEPMPSCCGDGVCEGSETGCTCERDCGASAAGETCDDGIDNDCNGLFDCDDPTCWDAPSCDSSSNCGDGICNPGESCHSCPPDCEGRLSGKRSDRFCCGDGMIAPPEGDGSICDGNW